MTSSNVCHLYIDVHAVKVEGSSHKQSYFVPTADQYARSLVSTLGQRSMRKRGSNVLVTPHIAHKLERIMITLVPQSVVAKITIQKMRELKEVYDDKRKRTE